MLSIAARQCVRTIERNTNTYSYCARHSYLKPPNNHVFIQGLLQRSPARLQKVSRVFNNNFFNNKISYFFTFSSTMRSYLLVLCEEQFSKFSFVFIVQNLYNYKTKKFFEKFTLILKIF